MAYATADDIRELADPDAIEGLDDVDLDRAAARASADIDLKLSVTPDLTDTPTAAALMRACVAQVVWEASPAGALAELGGLPVRIGNVSVGDASPSGAATTAPGAVSLAPRAWEELRRAGLVTARVTAC